ncbi:MAG: hypothetical protein COC01_04195 [Bacteroidetes bacterium]|nr:FKBP-type peptidyl-prolyl cis-trans isomerase [Bacteroidia bacterium]PCH68208.1 MAG: hypothetical protein COC01_04195 [Bacteroidota bacterium]
MKNFNWIIIGCLTILLGCGNGTDDGKMSKEEIKHTQEKLVEENKNNVSEEKQTMLKYLKDNNLQTTETGTGLNYIITEEGEGNKAEQGQVVKVHYAGRFLDGKIFDSSYDRGEPIDFPLGQGKVIKGWDEGLALLNEGAKATLIIPSHLAYGPNGIPNTIPPSATLIFDVELVEILN